MTTPEPDRTPTPDSANLVGHVISGRYRIEKLLGQGGMGAVYLAEHVLMRKRVALKLLHASMSNDDEVLVRFRREAEAAGRVEHPNVAAATDFGQTEDGGFFLVLEYVEGTSLREVLAKGPLSPTRSLHVARQIAFALERAHGAGVVHRDLKPENVMLVHRDDDPDFVKVLDFGIAKLEPQMNRDTSQVLTRLGTIIGTPEYMAPEQALGEPVGPGADLYAVGVVLYEMLTGHHPFDADERMAILSMHIVAPVPPMIDRNPAIDVPPAIEALTRRLLEKDVKRRPENARALVGEIVTAAASSGIELPRTKSTRPFGRASPSEETEPSTRSDVAVTDDAPWRTDDALAVTDYGLPASQSRLPESAEVAGAHPIPPASAPLRRKLARWIVFAGWAAIPIATVLAIMAFIPARRSGALDREHDGASPRGSASAVRSKRAAPERVATEAARGIQAMETLAAEYPEDVAVHQQLAKMLNEANRTTDMLHVIGILARLDTKAVDTTLLRAVTESAEHAETSDETFSLLEGPLGPRGVDGLITLSTSKTASSATRTRAGKSLSRADVRANASAPAAVLLDFRSATSCTAKHDLLDRAEESGDDRILPALKSLKSTRGCGFVGMRDCWGCMRKDGALDAAIKAVEARSTL